MEPDWVEILRSSPVDFLIGPQRRRFSIHSGALKPLSTRLDAYVLFVEMSDRAGQACGPMDWTDVDVETFLRFAKFVYTGAYDVPVSSSRNQRGDDDTTTTTTEGHTSGTAQARIAFNRRVGPYHSLDSWYHLLRRNPRKRRFQSGRGRGRGQYPLLSEFCSLPHPASDDPYPDFDSATLVAHARLYALATRWRVASLRAAALTGIYHLLRHGDFLYDRVADVAVLVDFAFEGCRRREELERAARRGPAELEDDGDDEYEYGAPRDDLLINMVTLYGACVYGVFLLHPSFVAVCRQHGEFSGGILEWIGIGDEGGSQDQSESLDDVINDLAEMRCGGWGVEDEDEDFYEGWWVYNG